MKIPERIKQEGILEYAERLSGLYARTCDRERFWERRKGSLEFKLKKIKKSRKTLDSFGGDGILINQDFEKTIIIRYT
jgi:hypothetical protein